MGVRPGLYNRRTETSTCPEGVKQLDEDTRVSVARLQVQGPVARGDFHEKHLLLGFLLTTPPTGFFPVATLQVGNLVEEDRLARGRDIWRGSAGGWN